MGLPYVWPCCRSGQLKVKELLADRAPLGLSSDDALLGEPRAKGISMNYHHMEKLSVGLVCLLAAGGCSLEAAGTKTDHADVASSGDWPDAMDADDVKIAEVTLSNGETLGWYEVAPGVTLMGRELTQGSAPQTDYSEDDAKTLTPAEIFDKIVARVPQKVNPSFREGLVAASERTRALVESMNGSEKYRDRGGDVQSKGGASSMTGDVREAKQAVVDDSAFPWSQLEDHLACRTHRNWSVAWPHQSGDSWFRRTDNDKVDVLAACFRGQITYTVRVNTWSWETPVSRALAAGKGWAWNKSDYSLDFDVESRVTNSAGDGYHHCGSGWRD